MKIKLIIYFLILAGLFPARIFAQLTIHSVFCSGGLGNKKKGSTPQSSRKVDTSQTLCAFLGDEGYWAEEDGREPDGYDTLRMYMENCPLYPDAWRDFSNILSGAQTSIAIEPETYTYPDFLAWLKKVLYYNPDTNWYCNDVLDMITAEQSNEADEMSICQYMIESSKCPEFTSEFQSLYGTAAGWRHYLWLDSIIRLHPLYLMASGDSINADTLAHPFSDTAVPSLWQDSLEILMGPQYAGVQQSQPITSIALLSAQLLENPMRDEIDISFDMGRTALVTMQLSDVLGRTVPLTYAKYQLAQPGQHDASIPAPNLPPGIYYLRITTDTGDAITLKVVKE